MEKQVEPQLRDLILSARNEAGLTQAELSARVGRSQKWVSRIEQGVQVRPDIKDLRKLADILKLDLDELILATQITRSRHFARRMRDVPPPQVPGDPAMRAEMIEIVQRLATEKLWFALQQLRMTEHAQWQYTKRGE